jgi:hypothetical protein
MTCVYCTRPAQERHHFTACLAGQEHYLDPLATLPLCIPCHKAEHAAWRAVGLDEFDHPLLARTYRVTWTLGRLAELDHVLQPIHAVLLVIRDGVTELVAR